MPSFDTSPHSLEVAGGSDIALCCDMVVMAEDEGDAAKTSETIPQHSWEKWNAGPQDVFQVKVYDRNKRDQIWVLKKA